ncbi:MAG: class I SAM-dependent methyltransferase [Promethearchaeota archaeon]|nr:MAG: class I SAM-dependent methyltransferase [Candidatus Lokiarchaeota archaeon]
MNKKDFYEQHASFSHRTISEYHISPGIKCKFDTIKSFISSKLKFNTGIDLGSSGNSIFLFLKSIKNKSFFDLANYPLRLYKSKTFWHPVNGDMTNLPYRDNSFEIISALDVLEHVEDDELAIFEIQRTLKKKGLLIITVPHRKICYSDQDRIIGHYRRYDLEQIIDLMKKHNLKVIRSFGIYGPLMKISEIQASHPQKVEEKILSLRFLYDTNSMFRAFWKVIVYLGSKIMKLDAKYHGIKKNMNVGFIFIKVS